LVWSDQVTTVMPAKLNVASIEEPAETVPLAARAPPLAPVRDALVP
jgi:hypothetical protein